MIISGIRIRIARVSTFASVNGIPWLTGESLYNVYFLCRHMKFNLVRHFICLKTKMTEF